MVKRIQREFYRALWKRYSLIVPNVYLDWEYNEMDLLCVRKGSSFVDEIEIKVSKTDYYADFKKVVNVQKGIHTPPRGKPYALYEKALKHQALQLGYPHCNYFSFLLPEPLVDSCEIPDYAGLYVFKENKSGFCRVTEAKKAKRLHTRKLPVEYHVALGQKMAHRYWRSQK